MEPSNFQIPFDTELEQHILGAMVYEPGCVAEVIELVKPRYFYHKPHERLCAKIFDLWTEDEKLVELQAIAPYLEELGLSVSQVADMTRRVVTTKNIEYYCERLRDVAALRAAVRISQEVSEAAGLRDRESIRELIGKAESKLSRLTDMTIKTETIVTMKAAVLEFHEQFERTYYGTATGITGIPSGLQDLDAITAGFQSTDLIVIGARPSIGKTAFMLQLAQNMSLGFTDKPAVPGAIFSLEQSHGQLTQRMIANQAMIDAARLRSGLIDTDEWEKYTMASSRISEAKLVIDDQAGLTVAEIKAKARKIRREHGLKYIMIDYLGKIRAADKRMDRYEAVSENVRMLKDLAKDFEVPVILLAQLSRDVEKRQDKHPIMSDLRDSGEIEQEADIIGFLYRDDYYNAQTEKKSIMELSITKHRNGPIGLVEMAFLKQYNRIVNLDRGGDANVGRQQVARV